MYAKHSCCGYKAPLVRVKTYIMGLKREARGSGMCVLAISLKQPAMKISMSRQLTGRKYAKKEKKIYEY